MSSLVTTFKYEDELGLLLRAVAEPVAQLIAVEVESPAQARQVFTQLAALDPHRPAFRVELDYHSQTPLAVLDAARRQIQGAGPLASDAIPLLGLLDVSENRPGADDERAREFWRGANLLRESWDALGAQTVFFLQPFHYEWMLRSADHLAAWIPLKVHLRRLQPPLRDGMAVSTPTFQRLPEAEARERLERLSSQLAEAKARGAGADASLLRRFYLPLAEAALALNDVGRAKGFLEQAQGLADQMSPADEPLWFELNAELLAALGDRAGAEEFALQMADWAVRHGDTATRARSLFLLANSLGRHGEHEAARERFEEARQLYHRVGDLLGEANCILGLGDIAVLRSGYRAGRALYEEALALLRRVGEPLGEANCIRSLGDIALRRSDLEGARARYEEALLLYRRAGNLLGEANCIGSLGNVALRYPDLEGARARFEEALPLFRRVGFLPGEANCILNLGDTAVLRSDYEAGRALYEEALALFRRAGQPLGEANCVLGLGEIARRRSDNEGARQRYEEALRIYERIQDAHSQGQAHRRLALVAASAEERERHVEAARALWRPLGMPHLMAELDREFGPAKEQPEGAAARSA